jgi:lipopolysaccharide transport system ATP-binding protein
MNDPVMQLRGVGFYYLTRRGLFSTRQVQALTEIDLDLFAGETLGIIGNNGSGKSTLLKLLARIYRPQTGSISFHARRISLLSLALGFDPQLTGRDNGILSSMLLGASYRQARLKIGEILEFSELGKFCDQPVKTYSSGMRSRLGFSVALHMEADVLLVDEALAVGDAAFKAKSEKAITERLNSNQTVVMVSHSAQQITRLSDRAIWLDKGKIVASGEPGEVVEHYIASAAPKSD